MVSHESAETGKSGLFLCAVGGACESKRAGTALHFALPLTLCWALLGSVAQVHSAVRCTVVTSVLLGQKMLVSKPLWFDKVFSR